MCWCVCDWCVIGVCDWCVPVGVVVCVWLDGGLLGGSCSVFTEGDRVVTSRCCVVVPVPWQVGAKTVVCVCVTTRGAEARFRSSPNSASIRHAIRGDAPKRRTTRRRRRRGVRSHV